MIQTFKNINKDKSLSFGLTGALIAGISVFVILILLMLITIVITGPALFILAFCVYLIAGMVTFFISKKITKIGIKNWKDLVMKLVFVFLITEIPMIILSGPIASSITGMMVTSTAAALNYGPHSCSGFDVCDLQIGFYSSCPKPTEENKNFNSLNPFLNCENGTGSSRCRIFNLCAFIRQYFIYFGPHNPITLFLGAFIAWRFLKW